MSRILFLLLFALIASNVHAQYIHKYNEVFTGNKTHATNKKFYNAALIETITFDPAATIPEE